MVLTYTPLYFRKGSSVLFRSQFCSGASSPQAVVVIVVVLLLFFGLFLFCKSRQYPRVQRATNVPTTSLLPGDWNHLGAHQQCRISGSTPDQLNQNFYPNKILVLGDISPWVAPTSCLLSRGIDNFCFQGYLYSKRSQKTEMISLSRAEWVNVFAMRLIK